jgi:hypothetical protein
MSDSIAVETQVKQTRTRRERPPVNLDQAGRLYVADLLSVLRISRAALYAGFKPRPDGTTRYPLPDGHDAHRPYWNTQTVKSFLGQ